MIIPTDQTRPTNRVLARVAGLLAILAALLCLPPAALAVTPTPSGQFVSGTGSSEEAAQRSRRDVFQSGLELGLRAQEAFDRGAYEEAELLYELALPLFERALGLEDLRMVGPLVNLADVYRARGEFDRAEVLYARLAFVMEQAFGPSDIHVGAALASTAEAVASQGHYGRAKNLYQRALSIYQASLGPEDPRTVGLFNDFAELLVKLNRRDKAEALDAGAPDVGQDPLKGAKP
jgi:tetratricopeptide (TPR) repeat protein